METQNNKKRILIVDDEVMLTNLLERSLSQDFEIRTANSGNDAAKTCEREAFDLLVMDVNMPEVDGFQALTLIRQTDKNRQTPVLFLSGRGELDSKLLAFDLGVQDYMTKPIHTKELKARIKIHLERASKPGSPEPEVIDGSTIRFHVSENRVFLKDAQQFTDLTKIECGILKSLMTAPEHVVSREVILRAVWGEELNVLTRTVDAHIKKIRKKLGPASDVIESIHGVGYRYKAAIAKTGDRIAG